MGKKRMSTFANLTIRSWLSHYVPSPFTNLRFAHGLSLRLSPFTKTNLTYKSSGKSHTREEQKKEYRKYSVLRLRKRSKLHTRRKETALEPLACLTTTALLILRPFPMPGIYHIFTGCWIYILHYLLSNQRKISLIFLSRYTCHLCTRRQETAFEPLNTSLSTASLLLRQLTASKIYHIFTCCWIHKLIYNLTSI